MWTCCGIDTVSSVIPCLIQCRAREMWCLRFPGIAAVGFTTTSTFCRTARDPSSDVCCCAEEHIMEKVQNWYRLCAKFHSRLRVIGGIPSCFLFMIAVIQNESPCSTSSLSQTLETCRALVSVPSYSVPSWERSREASLVCRNSRWVTLPSTNCCCPIKIREGRLRFPGAAGFCVEDISNVYFSFVFFVFFVVCVCCEWNCAG